MLKKDNKINEKIYVRDLSTLTQLRYLSAMLMKSYMNDKKYTNNDILTKKLSPEFFLEEHENMRDLLTLDEEGVEDMLCIMREILYTILVDFPDKATNKSSKLKSNKKP